MSDIYCSSPEACAQRAPLGPVDESCICQSPQKIQSLLNESEYEIGKEQAKSRPQRKVVDLRDNANFTEFEFADDAISLNGDRPPSRTSIASSKETENPYINVNGKEELPSKQEICQYPPVDESSSPPKKINLDSSLKNGDDVDVDNVNLKIGSPDFDSNSNKIKARKITRCYTLPKCKNKHGVLAPPVRITPDGTHIFYWCDMAKRPGTDQNPYI